MKAVLIDPDLGTVKDIDGPFDDFRQIQKIIECDYFTIAGYIGEFPVRDAVYCDDEGMLKLNLIYTKMDHYPQPLAGRILVIGAKADGNSKDTNFGADEIRKQVKFLTLSQVRAQYAS